MPKPIRPIKSVLFVCTANQCRSPMAEVLFRHMVEGIDPNSKWEIASAGCWARPENPATPTAIEVMQDQGIDLSTHLSQPISEDLLKRFNLILCMEEEHKHYIQRNSISAKHKTYLLSEMVGKKKEIWDPIGLSKDSYEETANEILSILRQGFEKITVLASHAK